MCMVVKEGGTVSMLVPNGALARIQTPLEASHMEVTVLQDVGREDAAPSPSPEPSLVIAKKATVPLPNETNGIDATAEPRQVVTIVQAANPTEEARVLTFKLIESLEKHGCETSVFSWGSDMSTLAGKSCISLLEVQNPLLVDLSADDFAAVKKLLLETAQLFWVTALDDPGTAMIDGLVRVVRNETPGLRLRVFHADEQPSLAQVKRLADVMTRAFLWTGEDNEFQVRDGLVHVSRIEEDTALNEEIYSLLPGAEKTVVSLPLKEIQCPVKLCVRSPGMLSSVCLEADDEAETELEPDYIEIQVKATALK
ncbi:hypothetical protein VTK56DRAFT_8610 [Thermocarpiscus australiensis]